MPRQYSVRDFFRHVSDALLARNFSARWLLVDLDFAAPLEGKPELLIEALLPAVSKTISSRALSPTGEGRFPCPAGARPCQGWRERARRCAYQSKPLEHLARHVSDYRIPDRGGSVGRA